MENIIDSGKIHRDNGKKYIQWRKKEIVKKNSDKEIQRYWKKKIVEKIMEQNRE